MIQFADLFKDCMSQFRETPEFTILNKHRVQGESLTAQERQAILDSVERTFAPLFYQIKNDASSLTNADLVFCVLSNIGIDATTIADCLTISPHTVRVRKHRMREKLPASWYDVFYGDVDNGLVKEPVDDVSSKSRRSFVGVLADCYRNSFNTKGRASRFEYYCFFFFALFLVYTGDSIEDILFRYPFFAIKNTTLVFEYIFLHVVTWIITLSVLPPMMAVTVRRLHDLNRSGWWALLLCGLPCAIIIIQNIMGTIFTDVFYGRAEIPQYFEQYCQKPLRFAFHLLHVMFLIQILVFSIKGTKGTNDYGPDPLK